MEGSRTVAAALTGLLVASGVVFAQVTSPDGARYAEKCAAKFPEVKAEAAAYATTGNFTRSMKCVYACIFQESGKMTADGKMVLEKDLDSTVPSYAREILQPCYSAGPNPDVCEAAFQWVQCVREKEPEIQARQSSEAKVKEEKGNTPTRPHPRQKPSNAV